MIASICLWKHLNSIQGTWRDGSEWKIWSSKSSEWNKNTTDSYNNFISTKAMAWYTWAEHFWRQLFIPSHFERGYTPKKMRNSHLTYLLTRQHSTLWSQWKFTYDAYLVWGVVCVESKENFTERLYVCLFIYLCIWTPEIVDGLGWFCTEVVAVRHI